MLTKELTKSKSPTSRLLLCAAAFTALSAVGCADDASLETEEGSEQDTLALQAPDSQQQTVPNPNGTYFVSVTPNGTGCPSGSTQTSISNDGLTFTTTFNSYEVEISKQQRSVTKDCQLVIKLHSPQGLSFAVSKFYYQGYAVLDKNVTGFQTAAYYFQGFPAPVLETTQRTDLKGEKDGSYLFTDTVGTADLVWSPCGLDRNLNVVTRLALRNPSNTADRGDGYLNLSAIDGNTRTAWKVSFDLSTKKCSTGGGTTPPNNNNNNNNNNGGRNQGRGRTGR